MIGVMSEISLQSQPLFGSRQTSLFFISGTSLSLSAVKGYQPAVYHVFTLSSMDLAALKEISILMRYCEISHHPWEI